MAKSSEERRKPRRVLWQVVPMGLGATACAVGVTSPLPVNEVLNWGVSGLVVAAAVCWVGRPVIDVIAGVPETRRARAWAARQDWSTPERVELVEADEVVDAPVRAELTRPRLRIEPATVDRSAA